MTRFSFVLVLSSVAALTLGACSTDPVMPDMSNAHYWQRAETSSSVWQRGPKAQQTLHRDISRCTAEIRELQRLGAIRAQMPADPKNPGPLGKWETPERDGYLYAEHSDYHDFETCMQFAGWERVEYLPYDVATQARETYIDTINTERRRSRSGERSMTVVEKGPYDNLNE